MTLGANKWYTNNSWTTIFLRPLTLHKNENMIIFNWSVQTKTMKINEVPILDFQIQSYDITAIKQFSTGQRCTKSQTTLSWQRSCIHSKLIKIDLTLIIRINRYPKKTLFWLDSSFLLQHNRISCWTSDH